MISSQLPQLASQQHKKKQIGAIAEYVLGVFLLLFLLAIPLCDFVSVGIRINGLVCACRDAAFFAAKAKSFKADVSGTELSAVTTANNILKALPSHFNGISVPKVVTFIVVTDLTSGSVTRYSTPLATPANTDKFLYNIEVVATADIDPLIFFNRTIFGDIPGLTASFPMTIRSSEYCEFPQGLNL